MAVLTWLLPGPVDWFAGHVPGGGLLRDGTRTLGAVRSRSTPCLPAVGVEVLAGRCPAARRRYGDWSPPRAALLPVILLYDAAWGLSGSPAPGRLTRPPAAETRGRSSTSARGDLLVLPVRHLPRAGVEPRTHRCSTRCGRYLPPDYVADDDLVVDGTTVPGEDPRVAEVRAALARARPPRPGRRPRSRSGSAERRDRARRARPARPSDASPERRSPRRSPTSSWSGLDGAAAPREVGRPVRRAAMGLAWLVYLGALLGGLVGRALHAVRARRANSRNRPGDRVA